jgi:hypothetical protein
MTLTPAKDGRGPKIKVKYQIANKSCKHQRLAREPVHHPSPHEIDEEASSHHRDEANRGVEGSQQVHLLIAAGFKHERPD